MSRGVSPSLSFFPQCGPPQGCPCCCKLPHFLLFCAWVVSPYPYRPHPHLFICRCALKLPCLFHLPFPGKRLPSGSGNAWQCSRLMWKVSNCVQLLVSLSEASVFWVIALDPQPNSWVIGLHFVHSLMCRPYYNSSLEKEDQPGLWSDWLRLNSATEFSCGLPS